MKVSREGLTPDTNERVDALLSSAEARGWPLVITSAKRSCEEQRRIFAQGRTTPGAIVSYADGCMSWHVQGRAVDVSFAKGAPTHWAELGVLGKSLGFRWGGDFPNFPDVGHFEYHPGMTIEQVCPDPSQCHDTQVVPATVATTVSRGFPWLPVVAGVAAGIAVATNVFRKM